MPSYSFCIVPIRKNVVKGHVTHYAYMSTSLSITYGTVERHSLDLLLYSRYMALSRCSGMDYQLIYTCFFWKFRFVT